jgi:hypothetical protein
MTTKQAEHLIVSKTFMQYKHLPFYCVCKGLMMVDNPWWPLVASALAYVGYAKMPLCRALGQELASRLPELSIHLQSGLSNKIKNQSEVLATCQNEQIASPPPPIHTSAC